MPDRNLIVVDIDSTLFDFIRAFAHVSDRDHGIACGLKPDEWNALIVDFADPALAIATFPRAYDHDMIEFNQPYDGAQDGVQRLKNLGYRIAYYTDRPQESVAATEEWLDHYAFPKGELHVCSDKRAELMKRKDEIATIIDDRPRTLIWGRHELGLDEVFSLRHGYNRNLIDIPGVNLFDSWDGMVMAIEMTMGEYRSGVKA